MPPDKAKNSALLGALGLSPYEEHSEQDVQHARAQLCRELRVDESISDDELIEREKQSLHDLHGRVADGPTLEESLASILPDTAPPSAIDPGQLASLVRRSHNGLQPVTPEPTFGTPRSTFTGMKSVSAKTAEKASLNGLRSAQNTKLGAALSSGGGFWSFIKSIFVKKS